MSQQQKLEKVLDLLINEDSDQAAELLHQIIVEKARVIYESIVDEEADDEDTEVVEESDEVGGEPNKDFTDEISDDKAEIDADEQNGGTAEGDDESGDEEGEGDEDGADAFGGSDDDMSTEEKVEDLEAQLAELRAEFDALMGEEMMEPNHADLGGMGDDMGDDMDADIGDAGGMDQGAAGFGKDQQVVGEVVASMFEKQAKGKLAVAPQSKKQGNKVAEETKFLNTVSDTGQKGTAKLVGTGKNTPLGAEQNKSPYTSIPARKDYGGKPTKIGGNGGTGGEYGKYNGDSAASKTPTDNVNVAPKKSGVAADTTPKYTGGKAAGPGFTKSPLTKKPA